DEIADEMKDRVLIDRLGAIALAVAAHVRRDRMKTGRSQRIKLVAPGVPALRKAVAEQHERALAELGDVQADAVGLDHTLGRLAHVIASTESPWTELKLDPIKRWQFSRARITLRRSRPWF